MKVTGLDGRVHQLNLSGYGHRSNPSSYHLRARILLEKLFPFEQRLEEVSLPGTNRLTADFLLPFYRLIVEVHGEQHYKFNHRMHKDQHGFHQSKLRDKNKEAWCEINRMRYVELPFSETDDEWTERLVGGRKNVGEGEGT